MEGCQVNRLLNKLVEHQKLLHVAIVVTVLVIALVMSAVGMEAGPWDGGP
jgi:hypothetical protein